MSDERTWERTDAITAAGRWARARSYHHRDYSPDRVRARRTATISVCVPARETAETIGRVVSELMALRELEAIDQVAVIDAGSADGTADVAARAGAEVHQEADLMADWGPVLGKGDAMWRGGRGLAGGWGPVLGKGDAMWRALSVLHGDVVCYVDGDSQDFARHFASGTAGPVACGP